MTLRLHMYVSLEVIPASCVAHKAQFESSLVIYITIMMSYLLTLQIHNFPILQLLRKI